MDDSSRREIVARKTKNVDILKELSTDYDVKVLCSVADNKNATGEILDEIARRVLKYGISPSSQILINIVDNKNVTMDTLYFLCDCDDEGVLATIARVPNLRADICRKLVYTENLYVLEVLAKQSSTSLSILEEIFEVEDLDNDVYLSIASNVNADSKLLKKIFEIGGDGINEEIAFNHNAPPELLAIFAKGKDKYMRKIVSVNKNTDAETLKILASDCSEFIRKNVAQHEHTDAEILEILAKDKSDEVRKLVVENKNTPAEVLPFLAKDKERDISLAAIMHPNMPVETLKKYAKSNDRAERGAVVDNPSTPRNVMEVLAKDSDSTVKILAMMKLAKMQKS